MTLFAGRTTRRRSGGSGPAPTLTSARRTALPASSAVLAQGGDGYTIVGTNFVAGAQLEITGPTLVSTAFVSSTSLTATMPALAAGLYNLRVKNPDGQYSGNVSLIVVVDPATYALDGFHEQRGDTNDFSPTDTDGAGPDIAATWEGRASAGSSAGRNLTLTPGGWTLPDVNMTVDGARSVRFEPASDDLTTQPTGTLSFVSQAAWTLAFLIYVDPTTGAFTSATVGPRCIFYGNGYLAMTCGTSGSGAKVSVSMFTSVSTFIESAVFPLSAWTILVARYDGTSMKLRVAGVDSTPVAAPNMGPAGDYARVGHGATGSTLHDTLTRILSRSAWSDAQVDAWTNYLKYYRYPSAGLP